MKPTVHVNKHARSLKATMPKKPKAPYRTSPAYLSRMKSIVARFFKENPGWKKASGSDLDETVGYWADDVGSDLEEDESFRKIAEREKDRVSPEYDDEDGWHNFARDEVERYVSDSLSDKGKDLTGDSDDSDDSED